MSTTVDLGKITASVTVGTTTTGAAGTNASVSNSGTTQDAVLNFTIPRGAQGVQGPQGSTGPAGPQGNSGYTGAAGELEIVNNLTQGGATAALSAEMGRALAQNNSYYEATISGGSITVSGSNYLLSTVGEIRIKMPSAGTTASTLTIGNASNVQLWYNGAAVSAQNTWEADEIISVFYDGTRFMASNSQGGGGKAGKISYDNSQSGLASNNVQGALDELGQRAIIIDSNNIINGYPDVLGYITPDLKWVSNNNKRKHRAIPVAGADYVKVTAKSDHRSSITFATSDYVKPTTSDSGSNVPVCAGAELYYINTAETKIFRIPSDCAYVLVNITSDNSTFLTPTSVSFGEDINEIAQEDVTNTRYLIGYEKGIYRQAIGTSDNGFQLDPSYGLGVYIPVSKGDTVLWHYGDTEIRTMSLCVYDENGAYVYRYANNAERERLIENFMSTSSLSKFLIRASLLIANGSDNYVEVNGVRVWTAFNESLGNKFNKVDKVLNPFENLYFYNKSISTTTGGEADNTKRLSTSFIVHRGRYILSVADGYLIHSVNYYDENKTWYKGIYAPAQTVITEQQDIEGYIKIVVTNQDNTTDISLDAPINLTFNTYSGGGLDEFDDMLLTRTFNSSYNSTDVEAIRNKFSGLIKDKNKIETFLFFTDPHLTPNSRYEEMTEVVRDRYISALQKYYNSLPMDLCICGGDWLNFNHPFDTDCGWLGYSDAYMRKLFRNYYPIFGNHDNNPYTPSNSERNWLNALTYPTVMNLMFRENGRTYYSFDGLNTKFYIMNSGVSFIKGMTNSKYSRLVSNRWPQIEWLGNALLQDDADNSVIVMHIYSNASNPVNWFSEETGYRAYGIHDLGKNVKLLVTAYNNRQSITLNGITYNFANCNGRVMYIHCGHTHFDYVDTTGEVPIISTTNLEGGHLVNEEIVYDLIPTFDCCMNDLDNSALYMTRVGAGVSRIVNYSHKAVSVGGSISLTCKLSGTITWQTRNSSIATVSNGTVAGVSSGCTGIIATNESGEEEYWIVKVG